MSFISRARVVVTAGASGIGEAIARAFLDEGARVAVCDLSPEAVEAFRGEQPGAVGRVCDVTDEASVADFLGNLLEDWGGVDVVVNNAGIAGPTGPIESITTPDWHRCIQVNLDGILHTMRVLAPVMKEQKSGCVINISSTAGIFGYPLRTPYAAAKWGVIGLTKSLAWELGSYGVRVNAIAPGSVDGPRMDRVINAEASARGIDAGAVRADYAKSAALNTFIDSEDIANMCVFLASPAASRVCGQVIAVDGFTEGI